MNGDGGDDDDDDGDASWVVSAEGGTKGVTDLEDGQGYGFDRP